jgi:DNA processing protein
MDHSALFLHHMLGCPGFGPKRLKHILDKLGSQEKFITVTNKELRRIVSDNNAATLLRHRDEFNADRLIEFFAPHKQILLPYWHKHFPPLLREIPDMPLLLFALGDTTLLTKTTIAVVGTRKCTSYGVRACREIVRALSESGITVTSGLAFGIDALAHTAALDCGGATIAVTGSSLDENSFTPMKNIHLFRRIREHGCLVSEYPPGTEATPYSFPARNRIMAGMSIATVVIEAAAKSGSLLTSDLAFDYNREVFAVPGEIFSSQSTGTNMCIAKGAHPIISVSTILETLDLERSLHSQTTAAGTGTQPVGKTPEEQAVIDVLLHASGSLHIDRIVEKTTLKTMPVHTAVTMLELQGSIIQDEPNNYRLLC